MLRLPILDVLERSERILIAGAGGGYDIFSGLPLYFALRQAGKQVFLANYSFSYIHATRDEHLTPVLIAVSCESKGTDYFPELHLCRWFKQRGEDVTIYAFDRCGVKPMREGYELMVKLLDIDTIVLVDGGTDSLLKGNEQELGTPLEDMTSIAAVDQVDVKTKVLGCLGFGIDTFHGVCHAHVLESIASISKDEGGYLGALSLIDSMPEVLLFREATQFVFDQMPHHVSIVCSSILSALQGEFGNHHATTRTKGSLLFINPLMSLYWFFNLHSVASRVLYLSDLENTERCEEVLAAIKKFRNNCGSMKTKKSIPL